LVELRSTKKLNKNAAIVSVVFGQNVVTVILKIGEKIESKIKPLNLVGCTYLWQALQLFGFC
jgi:hypothetical protein